MYILSDTHAQVLDSSSHTHYSCLAFHDIIKTFYSEPYEGLRYDELHSMLALKALRKNYGLFCHPDNEFFREYVKEVSDVEALFKRLDDILNEN
jgi:hypothetical protein